MTLIFEMHKAKSGVRVFLKSCCNYALDKGILNNFHILLLDCFYKYIVNSVKILIALHQQKAHNVRYLKTCNSYSFH